MSDGHAAVPHAATTRRVKAKLRKMTKAEVRRTFVDAGIIGPDGRLTRRYAAPKVAGSR